MKKALFASIFLLIASVSFSQKVTTVDRFNYAGPYKVSEPLFSTPDARGKAFDRKSLMDAVPLTPKNYRTVSAGVLPEQEGTGVGVFSFFINDMAFHKVDVEVKGTKDYKA